MRSRTLKAAEGLVGTARLPGDKSISHRLAILGALAEGTTELVNYSSGRDCQSTLDCLAALGARMEQREESGVMVVRVEGRGLGGFEAPPRELDAGNSGSTLRMLAGALAAHPFESVLNRDPSLQRRRWAGDGAAAPDGRHTHRARRRFPPLRIREGRSARLTSHCRCPVHKVKTARAAGRPPRVREQLRWRSRCAPATTPRLL
jgi:3-phosphoshikimate 1-carboxyvinyltransferase